MDNETIANTLHQIADLMELQGANTFRTRAYRNAARVIVNMQDSAEDSISKGRISEKKGIGKSLYLKLQELVSTGQIAYLEDLKAKTPAGLFEMQKIPGMGPKRIKTLHQDLKISSVKELEAACKAGKVAALPRFGKKLQAQILDEIEHLEETAIRRPHGEVLPVAIKVREHFLKLPCVIRTKIAGSLRRGKPTVKDVDLLISSNEPEKVMEEARNYPSQKIIASGKTKTSLRLKGGLQVDIRVVKPESFACALTYFTGSKDFNVRLRQLALEKGYSLSEYALRPLDGSTPPAIRTERELHEYLGLEYFPPNYRETDKEINRVIQKLKN